MRRGTARTNGLAAAALAGGGVIVVALWGSLALSGCGSSSEEETATAPPSFYGVMAQTTPSPDDVEQMAEIGVGTLRLFVPWSVLDPSDAPDDIDFSSLDPVFEAAAREGISVLPYFLGTPAWVAKRAGGRCVEACDVYPPVTPHALAAWREFVGAAVERYGAGGRFWTEHPDLPEEPVRAWQIWNEQNSPSFFAPRPDVDAYARLLAVAAETIRRRDPGAEIILGGMAATPLQGRPPALEATEFLRRLYAVPGARESFDAVAAHAYAANPISVVQQVRRMRAEIEAAGDDAELWVTEVGWSSDDGRHPLERGPEGQAESLAETFAELAERREEWDLSGVVVYAWRDYTATRLCDWCAYAGLLEEDGEKRKPAAAAFEALAGG